MPRNTRGYTPLQDENTKKDDKPQDQNFQGRSICQNRDSLTLGSGQKWWAAILLGIIFFILSSPIAYSITNTTLAKFGSLVGPEFSGPTLKSLIINTLVFILVVRLLMS